MIRLPSRRSDSILGLVWHEDRLHVVAATRARGTTAPGPAAVVPWPASDLTPDDALATGARLRAALEGAGVRPGACVVALPPAWVLSTTTALPALSAADLDSFAQLTAEQGFPCPPDELQIVRTTTKAGEQARLLLLAVRKDLLAKLTALLAAAGFKPRALTLAPPPALAAGAPGSPLFLELDAQQSTLTGLQNSEIALLRCLDPLGDSAVNLVRELRITWEQQPAALRATWPVVHVAGDADRLTAARPALARWADAAGLTVEASELTAETRGAARAQLLATTWLSTPAALLPFLPPDPGPWARWLSRYSSRRLGRVSIVAAGVLMLLIGTLVWRTLTLWNLRDRWSAMKADVEVQERLQGDVRFFRSWTDTTPRNLGVLKVVSEAFPASGSVTAKAIEIHGLSSVNVSGTTTDNAALLKSLDKLRQNASVSDLKLEQIHGRSPSQFTFKFTWQETTGK